jgi:hypothetical protein
VKAPVRGPRIVAGQFLANKEVWFRKFDEARFAMPTCLKDCSCQQWLLHFGCYKKVGQTVDGPNLSAEEEEFAETQVDEWVRMGALDPKE